MALKQSETQIMNSGNKLAPDELDQDQIYQVHSPNVVAGGIGTVSVVGNAGSTVVLGQPNMDFPRCVQLVILGVAGGQGGTAVVQGKDQFGNTISETMGFATAAGGGTALGTKVFAKVGTATVTAVGLGGTAIGTSYLGYPATGTDIAMTFGLPAKIGAAADLKRVTWHDADVSKSLTVGSGGTIGTAVAGTAMSSVTLTGLGGFVAADSYTFIYRSSFETEAQVFTT